MDMMVWNILLTVTLALGGWIASNMYREQQRISILLNRTREEIAKDYVTREEIERDMTKLLDQMNRISDKIDKLTSKTYFQE